MVDGVLGDEAFRVQSDLAGFLVAVVGAVAAAVIIDMVKSSRTVTSYSLTKTSITAVPPTGTSTSSGTTSLAVTTLPVTSEPTTVAQLPPGATPNTPGPADQERPVLGDAPFAAAMDGQSGRVVVVVFETESESAMTWTFDVITNRWQAMKPAREPDLGRWAPLVYDADADLIVAFPVDGVNPWTYSVETNLWTKLSPASPLKGSFADLDRLAYEPVSGLILLRDWLTTTLWAYAVETNTWTEVDQGGEVPPEVVITLLDYDGATNRLVLTMLGYQTWTFDTRAHLWSKRDAVLSEVNLDFFNRGREVTFDPAGARTVVFSDGVLATYDAAADAWTTVPAGAGWPPLAETSDGQPTGPLARVGHALVYDPVNERVVMLGGRVRMAADWLDPGDVWAYELRSNSWIQLVPPLAR